MELEECRGSNPFLVDDSDIPDLILNEILSRLPLKTKIQFKSVSKRWHSIISDTYMGKTLPWDILFRYSNGEYHQHPMLPEECMKGVQVTVKHYPEFNSPNFSLQFLENWSPQDYPSRLVATSNGLFLCCKKLYPQSEYCVCNPMTAEWISLPKPPANFVVLGFISEDWGYKVVRIIKKRKHTTRIKMEIFSSDIGEWKTKQVKCPQVIWSNRDFSKAVVYNGIMHWLLKDINLNSYGILAYDPNSDSDECRIIDLPSYKGIRFKEMTIGTSGGHLRYLSIEANRETRQSRNLCVYTLADYDAGNWRMDFNISLINIIDSLRLLTMVCHPYDMDVVYLARFTKTLVKQIASLNLQTRKLELITTRPPEARVDETTFFPIVLPPQPTPIPEPTWELDE